MNVGVEIEFHRRPGVRWRIFWLTLITLVGGALGFMSMLHGRVFAPLVNVVPMCAAGALAAALIRVGISKAREPVTPACPKCRYCMLHLDTLACPECGHRVASVAVWSRRRRQWLSGGLYVLAALLVVYSLALFCSSTLFTWERYMFSRQQDRWRAAGFPANGVELNAWYVTPPPGENAADVYEEAAKRYDESLKNTLPAYNPMITEPPANEPFPPGLLAAYEAYIASNQIALSLLEKAATMPRARFPGSYATSSPPHGDYGTMRRGVYLMLHSAKTNAIKGNSTRAVDEIIHAIRILDSLRFEPSSFTLVLRLACRGHAVRAVEDLLMRTDLTDDDIQRLDRELARSQAHDSESIERMAIGDRAMVGRLLTTPLTYIELGGPRFPVCYMVSGIREGDVRILGEITGELGEISKRRGYAMHLATEDLRQRAIHVPSPYFFSRSFASLYPNTLRAIEYSDVEINAVRVTLSIARYRLDHRGELPAKLEELVPKYLDAVPEDPIDGKPMRYARLPRGFTVYSVGLNGMDDGGKTSGSPHSPDDHGMRIDR